VPLAVLLEAATTWRTSGIDALPNILVVEPRRVAARAAAARIASTLGQEPGGIIGYAIRGETKCDRKRTRVTVLTDGVLLNKLREDPSLSGIDCVIFDEFHERGVGADVCLALCREAQRTVSPELRLVVMSATLLGSLTPALQPEAGGLLHVLGGSVECAVVRSNGRQFPVEMRFAGSGSPPMGALLARKNALEPAVVEATVTALLNAPSFSEATSDRGDVLVFMPGAREIRKVVNLLKDDIRISGVEVLPLYGALSRVEQDRAIFGGADSGGGKRRRRIVVSSPIAEASLTIAGITAVVDSGLRRVPSCDDDTGMQRLRTRLCSRSSATQRAGRAGRTQPGLCVRVYTQRDFEVEMTEDSPPEILTADLAPTLLNLAAWGCSRTAEVASSLPFVDPPRLESLTRARELLFALGAVAQVSQTGERMRDLAITPFGSELAAMPMHPRLAANVLRALTPAALVAATVSAMLLEDDIGGGAAVAGVGTADLTSQLQSFLRADNSRDLLQFAQRISDRARTATGSFLKGGAPTLAEVLDAVSGGALLPGFADMAARRASDAAYGGSSYLLANGRSVRLDGDRASSNGNGGPPSTRVEVNL